MDISKVLEIANNLLTIVILIGGTISYVFRTWISEWIKNRFSKAVNNELETQKHQLNKELEVYKGSLIRELEQYKANIDIKRSIALKMADKRLEALQSLIYELDKFNNECSTWPSLTANLRRHSATEFNETVASARIARRKAEIFLPLPLNGEIAAYMSFAMKLTQEFPTNSEATLQGNDPRIGEVAHKYINVLEQLRAEIFAAPVQLD